MILALLYSLPLLALVVYAIVRMAWHHRHLQRCQRARIHTHELSAMARADIQTCIAEVHAGALCAFGRYDSYSANGVGRVVIVIANEQTFDEIIRPALQAKSLAMPPMNPTEHTRDVGCGATTFSPSSEAPAAPRGPRRLVAQSLMHPRRPS